MEQKNNLAAQSAQASLLVKRLLLGWAIGLIVISFFIFRLNGPAPAEWGEYWRIRPLIVTPLAGIGAGLFYHLMQPLRNLGGWKKAATIIVCVIVYIVALWMGIVLGLDGTMWN